MLRLGDNNLECGAKSVVRAISQKGNIEELDLSRCNLQETQEMFEHLKRCHRLKRLNLSGNQNMQLVALAETLPSLRMLLALNLRAVAVPEQAWAVLIDNLKKCSYLSVQFDGLELSAAKLAASRRERDAARIGGDAKLAVVWQACHRSHSAL